MPRRRNNTNTGKDFENRVSEIAKLYEAQGKAVLRKCDPPSRTINVNGRVITTLLKNPFPDFVGVWTTAGGRALFIEAKSTKHPRLAIMCKSGGLTVQQTSALSCWHDAGAAVGVVWEHDLEWRFVSVPQIKKTLLMKRGTQPRKSIRWDEAEPIPSNGVVYMDFLENLGRLYFPKSPYGN